MSAHEFQLVKRAAIAQLYVCLACGGVMKDSAEEVWADRNGPPFRAYYHTKCKKEAEKNE